MSANDPTNTPSGARLSSLAAQAKQGDQSAFADIYQLRSRKVFYYLAKILRNASAADDATAETFLQAWKNIRKLRDPNRFDGWLFRIAHHVAMDELNRPTTTDLEDAPEPADLNPATDPDVMALRHVDSDLIGQALLELPDRYREVLVLRYFGDWSDGEVAQQLNTTQGNVRALRMRAMRRLRAIVDPPDGGVD
jgi:RNA polymerase sigma-70 factor (ECF subfamily)